MTKKNVKTTQWRNVRVLVEEVEVWPKKDPRRIDPTIDALRRAWKRTPDLRLGQLLSIVVGTQTAWEHVTDEYILKGFRRQFHLSQEGRKV